MTWYRYMLVLALAGGLLTVGCNAPTRVSPTIPSGSPFPTGTPTATPRPLAARVNGEPIPLEEYQQEIARFEAAQTSLGLDLATMDNYERLVLDAMIDERLLSQAARSEGATPAESSPNDALDRLVEDLGGLAALENWLEANRFTAETFREALTREQLAAEMVALIVDEIPKSMEQVHARHILLPSEAAAERILAELQDGADFAELARRESIDASTRPAGGDLGWFPDGYLLVPEVETAAFSLQPGEMSEVVPSELGFHIVQTVERGMHALSPDALRWAQEKAVQEWLTNRREQADIQIYITP